MSAIQGLRRPALSSAFARSQYASCSVNDLPLQRRIFFGRQLLPCGENGARISHWPDATPTSSRRSSAAPDSRRRTAHRRPRRPRAPDRRIGCPVRRELRRSLRAICRAPAAGSLQSKPMLAARFCNLSARCHSGNPREMPASRLVSVSPFFSRSRRLCSSHPTVCDSTSASLFRITIEHVRMTANHLVANRFRQHFQNRTRRVLGPCARERRPATKDRRVRRADHPYPFDRSASATSYASSIV